MILRSIIIILYTSLAAALWARSGEQRTYFDGDTISCADSILWLTPWYTNVHSADFELRASTRSTRALATIFWTFDSTPGSAIYSATFSLPDLSEDPYTAPASAVDLTLSWPRSKARITKGVGALGSYNTFAVAIDFQHHTLRLLGGASSLSEGIKADIPVPVNAIRFGVKIEGKWDLDLAVASVTPDRAAALRTAYTSEAIASILSESNAPPAGYWKYLDRDCDAQYARLGGEYRLAIVPDCDTDDFIIIYLDGAVTYTSVWQEGMIKGRLSPTPFEGHYDLIWYDAMMLPHSAECSATLEQPAILRLDMPLLKAKIRLAACDQDM